MEVKSELIYTELEFSTDDGRYGLCKCGNHRFRAIDDCYVACTSCKRLWPEPEITLIYVRDDE